MRLRVTVEEAWDTVLVEVGACVSIGDVKREALGRTVGGGAEGHNYVMKYRGAAVSEGATLESLEVPNGAAMIVIHVRRKPVR
jgi:hypothetical protein